MSGYRWLLNLALVGAITWLGYQNYLFWTAAPAGEPSATAEKAGSRVVAPTLPELPVPPAKEEFNLIEEKNLFTQTRAPAPIPVAAPAEIKPAPPPENLQERYSLYGVVRLDSNRYKAVIKDKKTPNSKAKAFSAGEMLPGSHLLKRIEEQRVFIATSSGGETELRLRGPKGAEDTGFVPKAVPATGVPSAAQPIPQPQPPAMPVPGMQRPVPPAAAQPRVVAPTTRPGSLQRGVVPPPEEEDMGEYDDEEYLDEDMEEMPEDMEEE